VHICTSGGQQLPRSSTCSFRVDAVHYKVDAAQVLFEGLVLRDPGAALISKYSEAKYDNKKQ